MTLDLARLEALAAAAIYPWPNDLDLHFRDGFPPETARLIAACDRTTVRALCARMRALEAVAERLAANLECIASREFDNEESAANFANTCARLARAELDRLP